MTFLPGGWSYIYSAKNKSAGTQHKMGDFTMAISKKLIYRRTIVGVPMSIKNKKLNVSFLIFLLQISKILSTMRHCNLHILIGNPKMITCFFSTKIDSAVPYNSAVHWGMLDIQYIAIRAKRNFKSSMNDPKTIIYTRKQESLQMHRCLFFF